MHSRGRGDQRRSGLIRVHRQLTRHREHGPLKTEAAKCEVVLAPAIGKLLRAQWLASSFKVPHHFVFANTQGRSLDYPDVGEDFRATLKRAGITVPGGERLTLHSLRHGFASLLISQRLDVVFISRQLGHANPNITLGTYAHLYARADHAATAAGCSRQATRRSTTRGPRARTVEMDAARAESARSTGSGTSRYLRWSCTPR